MTLRPKINCITMAEVEVETREPELVNDVWVPGTLDGISVEDLKKTAFGVCPWAFILMGTRSRVASKGRVLVSEFHHNKGISSYDRLVDKKAQVSTMRACFAEFARYFSTPSPTPPPCALEHHNFKKKLLPPF